MNIEECDCHHIIILYDIQKSKNITSARNLMSAVWYVHCQLSTRAAVGSAQEVTQKASYVQWFIQPLCLLFSHVPVPSYSTARMAKFWPPNIKFRSGRNILKSIQLVVSCQFHSERNTVVLFRTASAVLPPLAIKSLIESTCVSYPESRRNHQGSVL
jgi:hypothetical protein